jgi:hypothetical protein
MGLAEEADSDVVQLVQLAERGIDEGLKARRRMDLRERKRKR